jgi:hypothetical protein
VATSYQNTKYSRAKGALAFFNDLQHHANRMVQPPDEYFMKWKFLKGLPEDLVENLLKSRCVSAEHTLMAKLLCKVKAMESSIQAYHNYKSKRHKRPSTPSTTKPGGTPQSNTRTPHVVRFIKRNHGNYQGNTHRGPPNQGGLRPNYQTGNNNYNNNTRETKQNMPRPNNDNRSGSTGNTQNKPGHNHNSDIVCYKCGKPGHISPNCLTNGPRVFAAHVIDEDAEEAPQQENHD